MGARRDSAQGGDGADLWSQKASASVTAPKIAVADTVGAGDTFQTSLIKQLIDLQVQSDDWENQLNAEKLKAIGTFAATAAAVTCSRQGADLPNMQEVIQALSEQ